jgi:hypothetical protein
MTTDPSVCSVGCTVHHVVLVFLKTNENAFASAVWEQQTEELKSVSREQTDPSICQNFLEDRPSTIHHQTVNSQPNHLAILPTINYLLLIARSISISISININNTV